MKPEAKIVASIKKLLKKNKVYVWKNTGSIYGKSGVSDLLGLISPRGQMIAIEVKSDAKKVPTELQLKFIEEIKDSGGIAFWAWSTEVVKQELLSHGISLE